ncbi:MAG: hypothetical protein JWN01_987 [Patescibacteria group bacterium]|nr:hypothetical protein [Patescibacteria group bacterium]
MSKLATVHRALGSNGEALILAVEEHTYFPDPWGYWTHTVDFIVVPEGGLYSVAELQAFMMGLVPLEETCRDDFHGDGGYLGFGKLYFDETIGTDAVAGTRTITITDPDVTLPASFVGGEMAIDLGKITNRQRRTWVRVYPDRDYATRATNGKDSYSTCNFRRP